VAVRVDREVFDPIAVGTTAGGVRFYDDGTPPVPWQPRPYGSKEEFVVSNALRLMSVPAEVIRQQRPPVPQMLFPPIYGYDDTPLTIEEVLDTDRWQPQIRSWVSGTPRHPRRNDYVDDAWSGTLRGFNASPNRAG
jgi:hypothetical protein